MRNLFKLLAIICITISACSSDPKATGDEILPDTAAIPGKSFAADLDSDNPVQIDSSEYVMYPLANKQKDDDGGSFISKGKFDSKTYWNIIFYNTITRKSYLLNKKGKMIILSYNQNRYDSYSSDNNYQTLGVTQAKGYILYSVISSDFNNDGRLDYHDPEYLFISDKQGNNFKQISPNDKNVLSWQLIEKSGVVLINTVTDKNNDKVFDEKDVTIPYTYDLKTGKPAEEVFPTEFNEIVNKAHNQQWPVKKK
ncbi:MAG: hypothetical protein V4456_13375 [Bacteroidota bacterium]